VGIGRRHDFILEVVMDSQMFRNSKPQHWAVLALAVILFLSPWLFGYHGLIRPEWNAWVVAVILAYLAFSSLSEPRAWEDWLALVLGAWLVVAPWVLQFSNDRRPLTVHLTIGILTILVSAAAIWQMQHPPHHLAQ
jgi:SPW repeat